MNWKLLQPYFFSYEKWGDHTKMKWYHMKMLYDVRKSMVDQGYNWPVKVHCAYDTKGHSERSMHYVGKATDFHFITKEPFTMQTAILYRTLEQLGYVEYTGMGVYPEWNNPGFHLDSRGTKLTWTHTLIDGYVYTDYISIMRMLKIKQNLQKT